MRILVTGAAGFVGRWLVPRLMERGDEVVGLRLPGEAAWDGPRWIPLDLRDAQATRQIVGDVRPDKVVHLAAVSFAPDAARDPLEALRVNYGALDALIHGMREFAQGALLLYIGTGDAYGGRPLNGPPCHEDDPLRPGNPYAATKAAAEQRCVLAGEREGLRIIRTRPLNHTGPGRPERYVESSIARQLVRVERKEQPAVLQLGNLDPVRDFSDVRDVVSAYELLLERGEPGSVYNVCSGRGCSVRELVDRLSRLAGVKVRVERNPDRYRPAPEDRLALVGDPARLRALGWEARYSLDETLRDLLDDWRSRA